MESKKDYVNRIFNEARLLGICSKQKEFAELLGMNQATISSAMMGKEGYLTDNIIRRIKAWEQQILVPRRAGSQQGPDIVIPAATAALYNNMAETIRLQAEMLARMQAGTPAPYPGVYAPKNFKIDGE